MIGKLAPTKVLVAWATLLGCETLSQISLKFAGRRTGAFDFTLSAFQSALGSGWLWMAITCYIGAFLAWMTILRKSRLSAAFANSAVIFILVMLASWLIFGERIGGIQLLGAGIIMAGILLIGSDDASAAISPPSTAAPRSL
jgi:drug/metabolite transporter (DMT)-like permease